MGENARFEMNRLIAEFYGQYTFADFPVYRQIATNSSDQTAKIWDLDTGKDILMIEHTNGVHDVAFSPDGKKLVSKNVS